MHILLLSFFVVSLHVHVSRVTCDEGRVCWIFCDFGVDRVRDNDKRKSEAKTSFARFNARVTFNHCKTLPLIGTWRCTLGAES